MSTIVHDIESIERLLCHGLAPLTDNREALIGLGFVPRYPNGRGRHMRGMWWRTVNYGYRHRDCRRVLIEQIAYLIS